MTTVLERIVAARREDVERRRREFPPALLDEGPAPRSGVFAAALSRPQIAVIAEHKRRSPSAGPIRADTSVSEIVGAYARGGAAALSVLTEERHFGGSLDDLREARRASELPLLRKDFIVDRYQLHEARSAGADAVLLIVAALAPAELGELDAAAAELGLEVLVEVHDRDELDRALELAPALIGINNRDLRDFSVDPGRTLALLEEVPDEVIVVSESGIEGPEQLAVLAAAGVHAALIGETLMRAEDPAAALARLRADLDARSSGFRDA